MEYDRKTALEVLKDISYRMRQSTNIFGGEELSISKEDFEWIRAKYLDNKNKRSKNE